jgi:hypothetical protein
MTTNNLSSYLVLLKEKTAILKYWNGGPQSPTLNRQNGIPSLVISSGDTPFCRSQ